MRNSRLSDVHSFLGLILLPFVVITFNAGQSFGETMEWNVASGNWSFENNWIPNEVPDTPGESALVPVSIGTTTLNLNMLPIIDWLDIDNPNATFNLSGNVLTTSEGFTNSGLTVANTGTSTINGDIVNSVGGEFRIPGWSYYLYLNSPSVINDGTFIVNSEKWYGCYLFFETDAALTGSGDILLNHERSYAQLNTSGAYTLTNGSGHTIHGTGQINATLINDGSVIADVSELVMELKTNPKTNNGFMKAVNEGCMEIYTEVDQGENGQIVADNGIIRLMTGSTISGGALDSDNGGFINVEDVHTTTLVDVTNLGDLLISGNSATATVEGSTLTNDGTIVVNADRWYSSYMVFDSDVTLDGSGDVLLNQNASAAQLNTSDGFTLTHGPEHTIHGFGQVNAALINNGSVIADESSQYLYVNPQGTGITNNGTFKVDAGCLMRLNDADLFTQAGGEMVVNGTLVVSGAPLDLQGGYLMGTGSVDGDVNNAAGTVDPGESAGALQIDGDFVQEVGGTLRIELGGGTPESEYDVLNITDSADLGGELQVALIDSFFPEVGQQFVVLNAGSVNESFDELTGPVHCEVTYNLDNVTITTMPLVLEVLDSPATVKRGEIGQWRVALRNDSSTRYMIDRGRLDIDGPGPIEVSFPLWSGKGRLNPGQEIRTWLELKVPNFAPKGTYFCNNVVSYQGEDLAWDGFVCEVVD
jgi:hypothetical protein